MKKKQQYTPDWDDWGAETGSGGAQDPNWGSAPGWGDNSGNSFRSAGRPNSSGGSNSFDFPESGGFPGSFEDTYYTPPRRSRLPVIASAAALVLALALGAAIVFLRKAGTEVPREENDPPARASFTLPPPTLPELTWPVETQLPAATQPVPTASDAPASETAPVTVPREPVIPLVKENRYHRGRLSPAEQEVYDAIYDCALYFEPQTAFFPLADEETGRRILDSVQNDYPEFFWLDSVFYSYQEAPGIMAQFRTMETLTRADVLNQQKFIDETLAPVLAELSGKPEYEKVVGVYTYLCDRFTYDLSYKGLSIYESLRDNRAVCHGYAKVTQYMLIKLGVEVIYVRGEATNDEGTDLHAWNIVNVEGNYYQLDTTWGDPVMEDGSEQLIYDYCMITDEMIRRSHSFDRTRYPACNSLDCNYFVRNGWYLPYYDERLIRNLLLPAAQDQGEIGFLCADGDVYAKTMSRLFDKVNGRNLAIDIGSEAIQGQFQYWFHYRDETYVIYVGYEKLSS